MPGPLFCSFGIGGRERECNVRWVDGGETGRERSGDGVGRGDGYDVVEAQQGNRTNSHENRTENASERE